MNKEELLRELSAKVGAGEVTRAEVMSRLGTVPTQTAQGESLAASGIMSKLSHLSITKILYIIGAAIVAVGIIIFIAQIWEDIGSIGRILVTLGLGLIFAVTGSVLLKQKPDQYIGAVFHFIGGVLIPSGVVVTLSELGVKVDSVWPLAIIFGVLFLSYVLLSTVHKHLVLTLFAITNGTAFVYLIVHAIVDSTGLQWRDLDAYLTMVVGASYLLLGHSFRDSWNKKLVDALYFFGVAGFLGAAFTQVWDNIFWELIYAPLVFGGLFLSVYMKSRNVLVMSTVFLLAYVGYITSEYFADSLGWPISLVILGFIFIGLGYASITINKKYIKA
ncbi:MAG: DUF2157 domain-containing protein [Parcubacteria group bacterium]|nr:DUF2157 domain-containing protein [Parcubacteria group bacterium]